LRSLILWLALLAVPFQSVAAAATMSHAPAPHGRLAVAIASAHPAMHHTGQFEVKQHQRPARMAMHGHCHGDDSTHSHHAGDKCSSCCTAAAMAAAPLPGLAVAAPPSLLIPFDARHLPNVHPRVAERPPSLLPA
jgi:hypothetical protein